MTDPFAEFKAVQRDAWALFAPLEVNTTLPAAHLVAYARVGPGQRVLDAACGTGVVAVTAARAGASVDGLDLAPALLTRARENADLAGVRIAFAEGDVEALPFADASFDAVLSQFGHIFAPRPEVATAELLRVLRPGGTLAFATWPPEHFVGRVMALTTRYLPPPPGIAPPPLWGDPDVVRERLGDRVDDVAFDRGVMTVPALSVPHYRATMEASAASFARLVRALATDDPERLASLRAELDALIAEVFDRNRVSQHYLLTRARKRP